MGDPACNNNLAPHHYNAAHHAADDACEKSCPESILHKLILQKFNHDDACPDGRGGPEPGEGHRGQRVLLGMCRHIPFSAFPP